jgi:pyridoxamine 5'-phosphate oxidase
VVGEHQDDDGALTESALTESPLTESPLTESPLTESPLTESSVDADPFRQFARWYADAIEAATGRDEVAAHAMCLSTVGPDGRPSARMVLLRGFDERGFVFYTNYESRKAVELEANPNAAVTFHWPDLARQVRAEGRVERVALEETIEYFAARPRGHRLGAWASPQSRTIPDRAWLEARLDEVDARFAGEEVPLPPFWGGYRMRPDRFELWLSRTDRLHDRLAYTRADGGWRLERLAP